MALPLIPIIVGISFVSAAYGLYNIRYTIESVEKVVVGENGIFSSFIGKAFIGIVATALLVRTFPALKKLKG